MDLYPAIDLRDGRCVRLYQGDYAQETVYGDDPVGQARAFAAEGARWIHVVDLDAARTGVAHNREVIAAIVAAVGPGQGADVGGVAVQAGGGVRDDASAEALLAAGVRRLVVGTAAIEAPDWVRRLTARHPGRVAVGLDARGHDVAVRGWVEGSGRDLVDMARRFDDAGVAALIATEIGRDGTLAGPALDQLSAVLAATELDVIASGGVGSLADLQALAALDVDGRRLAGAIVGRALYEGSFRLRDAIAAVEMPAASGKPAAAGKEERSRA
jgi:phosphoribosylformimino-5-aminoimidazole carboxamide ribotide isomerase